MLALASSMALRALAQAGKRVTAIAHPPLNRLADDDLLRSKDYDKAAKRRPWKRAPWVRSRDGCARCRLPWAEGIVGGRCGDCPRRIE